MKNVWILVFLSALMSACSSNNSSTDNNVQYATTQVSIKVKLDASASVLPDSGDTYETDGDDIALAVASTLNGYGRQYLDITYSDGSTTTLAIRANSSALEIAEQFNQIDGASATAHTVASIPLASYNNASGTMSISVNGISFQPVGIDDASQLADLGTKINQSALPGVRAEIDTFTGNLIITQDEGHDLVFGFAGTAADNFDIEGREEGPTAVTLDTASAICTVGGYVELTLATGMSLSNGSDTTPIIADLSGQPFVNNQFSPSDPDSYNHATSLAVYDSLGEPHALALYFVKQEFATYGANAWQLHLLIDEHDVGDPVVGTEPSRATYNLFFSENGELNTALSDDILVSNWTPLDENGNANGALGPQPVAEGGSLPIPSPVASSNFELALSGFQLAGDFSVVNADQNGQSSDSNSSDPTILTGSFVDSAVQGLAYSSASFSGTTTAEGEFTYRAFESVEFSAGALVLGEFEGQLRVSPFSSISTSEDRERAQNTIRLLQSLDGDNNPENGIDITSSVANDAEDLLSNIDLDMPVMEFGETSDHLEVLEALTGLSAFVSLQDGLAHTLDEHIALDIPIPALNTSKVTLNVQLDSSADVPDTSFDPEDVSSFNSHVEIDIYDSLGNAHELALYFVKSSSGTNVWKMHALIDDLNVGEPLAVEPDLATFVLILDSHPHQQSVLISNWDPKDQEGNSNGASGPLNIANGGSLPVIVGASSNFEIAMTLSESDEGFELLSVYQDGFSF